MPFVEVWNGRDKDIKVGYFDLPVDMFILQLLIQMCSLG